MHPRQSFFGLRRGRFCDAIGKFAGSIGACAFFMSILLVLSPQDLETKVITIKRSKI